MADTAPGAEPPAEVAAGPGPEQAPPERGPRERDGMLPPRRERRGVESAFVRLVATTGIVGIGVALGAILVGQKVDGWIVGLAVALTCVILSAVLWSSRRL
jgi:hypothetical protein